MSRRIPFVFWLGAGIALWTSWQQNKRAEQAAQWRRQQAGKQPGTAFITGASSGIGEAFARVLAQQGYHLVLLARREQRLRQIAADLEHNAGVHVAVMVADLNNPEDVERAARRLEEIPDLSILVNNAGFGTGGRFAEVDIQPELDMIQVHLSAPVRLTHAALKGMLARGRGGIIQVASLAGLLPMPGNALYGTTKSALIFFTESLDAELAGTGVRVQALCPGFTVTEFHDVAGVNRSVIPWFAWMRAEAVVRVSLQGLREGQVQVVPGRLYQLLALILRLPLVAPVANWVQKWRLEQQGLM